MTGLAVPYNNAFAANFGIHDPGTNDQGLGNAEVAAFEGDSGGPQFLTVNGQQEIAGITSFGYNGGLNGGPNPAEVHPGALDGSFGEFDFDTRVSAFATSFIDPILSGGSSATLVNQTTGGYRSMSSVAMDSNGDVVISWTSQGQAPTGNSVYARRFQLGSAAGSEQQLQPLAGRRATSTSSTPRSPGMSRTPRSPWTPAAISPSPGRATRTQAHRHPRPRRATRSTPNVTSAPPCWARSTARTGKSADSSKSAPPLWSATNAGRASPKTAPATR